MSVPNTNNDLFADSAALALNAAQVMGETFADFTSQSIAFWSAALNTAQPGPATAPNLQSPPQLSIVPAPSSTSTSIDIRANQRRTSTARSWYRKPVESPIETMMNFWGSFMPAAQFSNPWLPGIGSPQPAANAMGAVGAMGAMGAMTEMAAMAPWPNMLQSPFPAPTQPNPMTPWSFWQSAMPWQPSANSSATPAIADLYALANAGMWLSQPSHNGWTKTPTQEITDAWSWVAQSWSADPFGAAAFGPLSHKQARR